MIDIDDEIMFDDNINDDDNNPKVIKCMISKVDEMIYEICIYQDINMYIDIKEYVNITLRNNDFMGIDEIIDLNDNYSVNAMMIQKNHELMEYQQFQDWKYQQILSLSFENEKIMKIDNDITHFMDIFIRIYDNDNNHKLQCWSDINPFHLCMEMEDDDNMVILTKQYDIIKDPFIKFEFIK